MKLINDRVLLEREFKKEEKVGSIYIPENKQEKEMLLSATVKAVGVGRTLDNGVVKPMFVQVGDRVLVGKYAGTEVKFGDQEMLVCREDEILCVLEEGE